MPFALLSAGPALEIPNPLAFAAVLAEEEQDGSSPMETLAMLRDLAAAGPIEEPVVVDDDGDLVDAAATRAGLDARLVADVQARESPRGEPRGPASLEAVDGVVARPGASVLSPRAVRQRLEPPRCALDESD